MRFALPKYNTTGIEFVDEDIVPSSKMKDGKLVSANFTINIPVYRLAVIAQKMVNGKTKRAKKTLKFVTSQTTLINAIKEANRVYEKMMKALEEDSYSAQKEMYHPDMIFSGLWDSFLEHRLSIGKSNKEFEPFYNLHVKKHIHTKKLSAITVKDIMGIKAKMVGKSERSKHKVHQVLNPVYKYFNDIAQNKHFVKSAAAYNKDIHGKLADNNRRLLLSIEEIEEVFTELNSYPVTPFREVFMFLLHGRRINEVLTLEWSDVDVERGIYTIRAENNKAKVDMTYKITNRLKEALDVVESRGVNKYVFTSVNSDKKPLNEGTVRNHWLLTEASKAIVMHALRDCIGKLAKNSLGYTNDIIGPILGHKQSKTITDRYAEFEHSCLGDYITKILDKALGMEDDKLSQLRELFPNKSDEELELFLSS